MRMIEAIVEMHKGKKISHWNFYLERIYYRLKNKDNFIHLVDDKHIDITIDEFVRLYPTEERKASKSKEGPFVTVKTEFDTGWGIYDNHFGLSLEI